MQKRYFFLLMFCISSCLFFTTCGLDQFYLLEEPTVVHNTSYDTTTDFLLWYVDFETNETQNSDYYPSKKNAFTFLGTEIYYKIYNSASTLATHRSAISNVNTTSSYSAAATRMIETYHYQALGTNPEQNWTPFVECREKNQRVRIRLKSYGTNPTEELAAGIIIDNETKNVVPYRNGNRYSFDFFNDAEDTASDTPNREPEATDDNSGDYWYTQGTDTETYYVQLYAVAVGRDNNYTPSYSLVLDLGTIPIKKGE